MIKPSITEADLQAYVDNRLNGAERGEVEIYLATHPDEAQKLERYSHINEDIHGLFDPVLKEDIPSRLLATFHAAPESEVRPGRTRFAGMWARLRDGAGRLLSLGGSGGILVPAAPLGSWRPASFALTLTWLSLGVVLGWQMQHALPHNGMPPMVKHAAVAYVTYASEVSHPVEIQASDEDHLEAWLSKRLGINLKAPKLEAVGFTLMGGRLLAGTQGPAAQFMYEDKIGRRLTLYVKTQEMKYDQSAAFEFSQVNEVNAFYWIENGTGYVLSGNLERSDLLKAAEASYRQLNPPGEILRDSSTKKSASARVPTRLI